MNQSAVPFSYANCMGLDYPQLGPGPLDIGRYFSREYFETERERVFAKCWLWSGFRVEDFSQAGSYRVVEVDVWNASIILVRGRDDIIRGFYNVCSHRLNRVAYNKEGCAPHGFVCRFHGWTFDAQGNLASIPMEDMFCIDKAENGLASIAVEAWEGFVFLNKDAMPDRSLLNYLGEIAHGYESYFDGYAKVATLTTEVQANWKLCMDAFVETYHFAFVHSASTPNGLISPKNPYGLLDAAVLYDSHRIVSSRATVGPEYKPSPSEMLLARYGTASESAKPQTPSVNPKKFADWVSDVIVLFPSTIIQPFGNLGGWFIAQAFWPIAHDKTHYEMTLYMPPAKTAGEWLLHERNTSFLRDVIREDWNNMEMIQSNVDSGAKLKVNLGDQEIAVRHAYHVLDRVIGS